MYEFCANPLGTYVTEEQADSKTGMDFKIESVTRHRCRVADALARWIADIARAHELAERPARRGRVLVTLLRTAAFMGA
jgi:hypothetical protein